MSATLGFRLDRIPLKFQPLMEVAPTRSISPVRHARPLAGGPDGAADTCCGRAGHALVRAPPRADAARSDGAEVRARLQPRPRARTSPGRVVHAFPAVAEAVLRALVWPGDEPVERHGHVEDGCGHGVSFLAIPGYGGSPLAPARAKAQEAGCVPGGPVSTVGTYSRSWIRPSNVRLATISRARSG